MDDALIPILAGVALLAGVVDAVAGGGGLLTMPALLTAGLPPHLALGTNKGQSVFGAGGALLRFIRSPLLDRGRMPVAFASGMLGAVAGVLLLQLLAPAVLRPVIMVMLLAVVVFVLVSPNLGGGGQPRPRGKGATAGVAGGIGAYDGFFGPGTGTFLILAYVRLWGDSPQAASANAKVVNFASNAGALAVFACLGQVVWIPALAMGVGEFVGGWLGARLVVRHGGTLVRWMVVVVSLGLLAKLGWDQFR